MWACLHVFLKARENTGTFCALHSPVTAKHIKLDQCCCVFSYERAPEGPLWSLPTPFFHMSAPLLLKIKRGIIQITYTVRVSSLKMYPHSIHIDTECTVHLCMPLRQKGTNPFSLF